MKKNSGSTQEIAATSQPIFIYGVPGVGKTYLSRKIYQQLDLPLIEADSLRKEAHRRYTKQQNPFVYLSTTDAYTEFGDQTDGNVIKGLLAVRHAMHPFIIARIEEEPKGYIVEAAFLDPTTLINNAHGLLVVHTDEKSHRRQFLMHRPLQASRKHFLSARVIQDFLTTEANRIHVPAVESSISVPDVLRMLK